MQSSLLERTAAFSAGYGALVLTKKVFEPTDIIRETERNLTYLQALDVSQEDCTTGFPADAAHFHAVVSPLGELLNVYSDNDVTSLKIWNAIDSAPAISTDPGCRYGIAVPRGGKYRAVVFHLARNKEIVIMRHSGLFSDVNNAVSFLAANNSWQGLEVDNLFPVILGPSDRLFDAEGNRLLGPVRQMLQDRVVKPTLKV